MSLSPAERHVMEHATAWRHKQRLYRNHFVAGPGHDNWGVLKALCDRGLMRQSRGSELSGGDSVFVVTDEGLAALRRGR
jgi:hypothetical protein